MAQWEKIHLPMQETLVQSLGQEDPLDWAIESNILAWKILWTESLPGKVAVHWATKS